MASKISLKGILLGLTTAAFIVGNLAQADDGFYAYYGKIDSGQDFEKYSRTGEFADVIVNVGSAEGKLVFWRGSSFLPYWETAQGKWFLDEVIPRKGDGPPERPDKVNTYARIKIGSESPDEIVVAWRYLPEFGAGNPHTGVNAKDFVEEYFTIQPNGSVERAIKKGTPLIGDWLDPDNKQAQTIKLTPAGIESGEVKQGKSTASPVKVEGNPVKETTGKPALHWRFDEGVGYETVEGVTGIACAIPGHAALWKKGISGTALGFDGYNTAISLPAAQSPEIKRSLTVEAWVAIGAYPWNWAPIVQQGDDAGYFLGIGPHANAGFGLEANGKWVELISEQKLERNRWYYLAGTYDARSNQVSLYIDGEQVAKGNIQDLGGPTGALGEWVMIAWMEEFPAFRATLTFEESSGALSGTFKFGDEEMIVNAPKFEGDALTFDIPSNEDGGMQFVSTITDDTLKGTMTADMGEFRITGTRAGTSLLARNQEGDFENPLDVRVGQGRPRPASDPALSATHVDTYSLDGLLDEVKVHKRALSAISVRRAYEALNPGEAIVNNPDMEERWLPKAKGTGSFGAYYTRLDFYENWDNLWRFGEYSDVVVEFEDNPTKFVFWRGTGHIPMMVNGEEQWYSNEFNETWDKSGGKGCQEPMSDKKSYTNYTRILENSEARVVLHWRFPLQDVLHIYANYDEDTGWYDISDWYYYIYPDGVATKRMHLWTHGERNHEFQESMAIFGPNQHPEEIIKTVGSLTMANLAGQANDYSWADGAPEDVAQPADQVIQLVNYTGEYSPFTIGAFASSDCFNILSHPYSVFPTWNHWPVGQMASDGRNTKFPDRTAHCSLTWVRMENYAETLPEDSPTPFYSKILMEGMTNKAARELIPLAKSWLHPASLVIHSGAADARYVEPERAYVMTATATNITLTVNASPDTPVVNLALVVNNWSTANKGKVTVNGEAVEAKQGISRDARGILKNVIFIVCESQQPLEIAVSGAQP